MSLAKRRILSVDHNKDTCLMLEQLFVLNGYDVTTAVSSEEALSAAHKEAFNLYVLDLMMPDVDGAQLCRMIREFDPHTPIIIYSGAALEINREEALQAGADAFIAKPYIGELLGRIERFFS